MNKVPVESTVKTTDLSKIQNCLDTSKKVTPGDQKSGTCGNQTTKSTCKPQTVIPFYTDESGKPVTIEDGQPVYTDSDHNPITDSAGKPAHTDNRGNAITDIYGKAVSTDEYGNAVYTDLEGKTVSYEPSTSLDGIPEFTNDQGNRVTDRYGDNAYTNDLGEPITDLSGRAAYTNEEGHPITDHKGMALKTDSAGNHMYTDAFGQTITYTPGTMLTGISSVTNESGIRITDKFEQPAFTDKYRKPITDISGKAVFTDRYGGPVTDNRHMAVNTDPNGNPVYTDSKGHPITDRFGNPVNTDPYGRAVTDKNGKAVFTDRLGHQLTDKHGVAVATDDKGHPIYTDSSGHSITDRYGKPVYTDVSGHPMTDVDGHAVATDFLGKPLTDSLGRSVAVNEDNLPIYTDRHGQPITDRLGNPIYTDYNGNPLTDPNGLAAITDKDGRPLVTDRAGRPVFTDSHGAPITDSNGLPIFTDAEGRVIKDAEGRNVYTDSAGRAVYTYKDGSPITDGDGKYVYTDLAGNPHLKGQTVPMIAESSSEPDYVYDTEASIYDKDYDNEIKKIPKAQVEAAEKSTKCLEKVIGNGSIVCVCNENYCDKFPPILQTPNGTYMWYVSSKKGLRFDKRFAKFKLSDIYRAKDVFKLDENEKFQTIYGFGGAFTDSSGINMMLLAPETRKNLLESYFGYFGIGYTMGRVPIAGTDFSTRPYTYMDNVREISIDSFKLEEEDYEYKIPLIKIANDLTKNRLKLVASAWTAPNWMKTVCNVTKSATLKREFFDLWSKYHLKFLDEYNKEGIQFWAVTTGNEPMFTFYDADGDIPAINNMAWSPYEQSVWVREYLGPDLYEKYKNILIIAYDENRAFVPFYVPWFFSNFNGEKYMNLTYDLHNKAYDYVDGIGFHWYMDKSSNVKFMDWMEEMFPDKFLIYTEGCSFNMDLGEWSLAEQYATNIIRSLNHFATGWIDWNLALDLNGGPNWVNNYVSSPIMINFDGSEFYKQPSFYAMGHFSKFILPYSVRLKIIPEVTGGLYALAVERPDKGRVIVFYNENEDSREVTFVISEDRSLTLTVDGKSMNSLIYW